MTVAELIVLLLEQDQAAEVSVAIGQDENHDATLLDTVADENRVVIVA